jgi:hypothetical protein
MYHFGLFSGDDIILVEYFHASMIINTPRWPSEIDYAQIQPQTNYCFST